MSVIRAKFASVCFSCGEPIDVGEEVDHFREGRNVFWGHPECVAIALRLREES